MQLPYHSNILKEMPCRNTLQEHDSYSLLFLADGIGTITFLIHTYTPRKKKYIHHNLSNHIRHTWSNETTKSKIYQEKGVHYLPPPKKKSRNREGTYRCLPLQGRLSPVGCVGAVELDSAPGFSSPPFSEDEMRSGKARVFFYLGCGRNGRDMEAKVEPGKSLAPL